MSRSGRSGRVRREPVPVPVRPFVYTHATKNAGSRAKDIFAQKVTFVWEKPILAIESRASSRVVARAPLCPRCPRPGKSSTDRLCVRARAPSSVSSNSPTHDASTRQSIINRTNRAIFPRTFTARRRRRVVRVRVRVRPRGVRVAHLFVRARRVVRARAIVRSSHASAHRVDECRRAGAPVASRVGKKAWRPVRGCVSTLIIPVTFRIQRVMNTMRDTTHADARRRPESRRRPRRARSFRRASVVAVAARSSRLGAARRRRIVIRRRRRASERVRARRPTRSDANARRRPRADRGAPTRVDRRAKRRERRGRRSSETRISTWRGSARAKTTARDRRRDGAKARRRTRVDGRREGAARGRGEGRRRRDANAKANADAGSGGEGTTRRSERCGDITPSDRIGR